MLLYIHIPFCNTKCGYCAFFSSTDSHELIRPYVASLCQEISSCDNDYQISSIFIGGGTPNVLDISLYEMIFKSIFSRFKVSKNVEISIESNPNLLSKNYILGLKNLGVNRLSVGIQSFNQDKLEFLERDHSNYDFKNIASHLEYAYNIGLTNISIDLMIDTPLDSHQLLLHEIQSIQNLPIQHISAYSLSIDNGSSFAKRNIEPRKESFCFAFRDLLSQIGFAQYEVSNFSKNKECRHNLGYWHGEEYLGFGASSVGRIGHIRKSSGANITNYIKNPHHKYEEILSENDLRIEKILLGIRTIYGVEKDIVDTDKLKFLLEGNKAFTKNDRIIANELFLSDEIALWLIK